MSTYNLRRFANPECLKTINPSYLVQFLDPHRAHLAKRGLTLPPPLGTEEVDYELLTQILQSSDADTPQPLIDSLFYVNEMSTTDSMDELLKAAEGTGLHLDVGKDPTPADVAIQVVLRDPQLIEYKHAEQYLQKPRSYEYFGSAKEGWAQLRTPGQRKIRAIEKALDKAFEAKKRGRSTKVFVFERGSEIELLIRHGEPCRREGAIAKGQSASVFYRPECFDVIGLDRYVGELRIHSKSNWERQLYREVLGRQLFKDENFFPQTDKYTLEPLRNDGKRSLVCVDVLGIEWIRLREIWFRWGGVNGEVQMHRAEDVFDSLEARLASMPHHPRIIKASFLVKFTDSKTARVVKIKPPNVTQYVRDGDGVVVEHWLIKRNFVKVGKRGKVGDGKLMGRPGAIAEPRRREDGVEKAVGE